MQPIDYFGMAMKHAEAGEAAGDRFLGALRQAKKDKREDIKHERYEAYHDAISQGADPQQVMQQFPEFAGETAAHFKQVQSFRDNDMGRKAAMLSQALQDPSIDNTQALSAFATELANSDPNDEFTPETTLQLLQGPQGGEVLNMVAKLGGVSSGQQAVKPMTEYQQESTRLRQEQLATDREKLKNDQELKRLRAAQQKADSEAKREEIQQRIDSKKKEAEENKQQDMQRIEDGIYAAEQNKIVIDDLLKNDDYMDAVTGYANYSKVPEKMRTTTQVEAANYIDNIKNSMTIKNLGVMSGPLTDKDIQIIASASSRLSVGMSEKALKKELKTISEAYDRVINNFTKEQNRKGYKTGTAAPSQSSETKTINWADL